ncbi:hypothetical protein CASFOL_035235 [Castilleja foliolosa]|uniref:Uncharacterized protein n=1 Tax=Castilleja foliolosa TaxID=1961234 RepID=A0ABD3BS16_9LAMI
MGSKMSATAIFILMLTLSAGMVVEAKECFETITMKNTSCPDNETCISYCKPPYNKYSYCSAGIQLCKCCGFKLCKCS